jgi:hypothetical protein
VKSWRELQDDLRKMILRKGPKKIAAEIPAHISTVYRLMKARRPSLAIRVRIEQLSKEQEQ